MNSYSENHIKRDFIKILSNGDINEESSYLDKVYFITRGIDIKNAENLRAELGWDIRSFSAAIRTTSKSYLRYKKEIKPLDVTLSENAFEIAKLASFCFHYFESIDRFNSWLNTHSLQFDYKKPFTFIDSIIGRKLIKSTLNSLQYSYNA